MPISFTRRGRYRLVRDGVEISRHNVELEAVERGLGDAEINGAGRYRIYPPEYVEFDVPVVSIVAGSRPGGVQAGGGGGGGGAYAATHYVAPFASVAGASNDYADLGATSWTNAANSGTPTTLGTACARAVAGNKVQCAAGTYTGTRNSDRWTAIWVAANAGSYGNPIIFFAVNPAATDPGTTANHSKLDGPFTVYVGGAKGPIVAINTNYVIWDGFMANEAESRAGPSSGLFQMNSTTGSEFRRIMIDRTGVTDYNTWSGGPGYNGNAFFSQVTTDCKWRDIYVTGDGNITNQNDSVIELYNATNGTIEYGTWLNCGPAIFVKTEAPESQIGVAHNQENVHVRYNKINSYSGIQNQTSRSTYIYFNEIVFAQGYGIRWGATAANNQIACIMQAYNNTILGDAGASTGAISCQGAHVMGVGSEFYNNLCRISGAGNGHLTVLTEGGGWGGASYGDLSDIRRFNYNFYVDATPRWNADGSVFTSIATYQGQVDNYGTDGYGALYEANSQHGTVTFVNEGAGNYKLSDNGQAALTASVTGGKVGCWVTDSEEIGVRANPTY